VPTEDGSIPDHPLPLFHSDRAGEHQERGLLLLLNAIIFAITAILIGIAAALSLGNPITVVEDIKTSLTDNSAHQPRSVQSTPTIQSAADVQALPTASRDAHDEIPAASDTADQRNGEISEAPSDAQFKQFLAWAAKNDVPTQVERVQPMQEARAQDLHDAQAPVRPILRHQGIRPLQHPQARVRRDQNARVEVRPVRDARAQDQSAQNAQAPSFLQRLGLRP
jgi:hypothetical protein